MELGHALGTVGQGRQGYCSSCGPCSYLRLAGVGSSIARFPGSPAVGGVAAAGRAAELDFLVAGAPALAMRRRSSTFWRHHCMGVDLRLRGSRKRSSGTSHSDFDLSSTTQRHTYSSPRQIKSFLHRNGLAMVCSLGATSLPLKSPPWDVRRKARPSFPAGFPPSRRDVVLALASRSASCPNAIPASTPPSSEDQPVSTPSFSDSFHQRGLLQSMRSPRRHSTASTLGRVWEPLAVR